MGASPPIFGQPTNHIPIGARVIVTHGDTMGLPTYLHGTVTGRGWYPFQAVGYLVTLDTPLEAKSFEGWTTICVPLSALSRV